MSGPLLKRDRYKEVCCTLMTWITRIQAWHTHTDTHTLVVMIEWLKQWTRVRECESVAFESARGWHFICTATGQRGLRTHTHTHTLTHSRLSISHRYTATFGPHCCEKSGICFDLWHLSSCALLELIHANGALRVIRNYTYDSYALLITSLQIIPPSDCICFPIESD